MLGGKVAEESHDELGVHVMRVSHDALDVRELGEVLCSALEKPGLLAEFGHVLAVIVGEHVVLHNGVCDLRGPSKEVHLEELSLKNGLRGVVVLEGLKEESGTLLHAVHAHENISGLLDIDEAATLGACKLLGELNGTLRVLVEELLKHHAVVTPVANLGSVSNKLVKFAALCEAIYGLLGHVGAKVDRKGHLDVSAGEEIAELL
mmetsp:Transcript_22309/g.46377  ORF Transcript_22309/g.46377 Transcript_22309/m.46377 type:complete len:205 (+) Transcript_22309:3242-3856(+)